MSPGSQRDGDHGDYGQNVTSAAVASHAASQHLSALDSLVTELYQKSGGYSFGISRQQWDAILAGIVQKYVRPEEGQESVRELLTKLKVEDLGLARGCVAGNDSAWEVLLLRYREQLYDIATGIANDDVRGRELADSLYAELFGVDSRGAQRVSKLTFYTGVGSLGGWLRTVLAQAFIDQYRSEQRFVSLDEEEATANEEPAVVAQQELAVDPRVEEATEEALAAVSDDDRLLLTCHFLDGNTLAGIAATMGVHESTVSRRIERTVRKLHKSIRNGLLRRGMNRAQAEEALSVDVRDLRVNVRQQLQKNSQETAPQSFLRQKEKEKAAGHQG